MKWEKIAPTVRDALEVITRDAPANSELKNKAQSRDYDVDFALLFQIREYLHSEAGLACYKNLFPDVSKKDANKEYKYSHDGCVYTLGPDSRLDLVEYQLYRSEQTGPLADVKPMGDYRAMYYYQNELDHFFSHLIVNHLKGIRCQFREEGINALWIEMRKQIDALPDNKK